MKRKMFLWTGGIIIILIVAVLISFHYRSSIHGKEITLPVVADLTGPIALYGQWAIDGLNMAVDDINSEGGINGRKVKLVVEDGQSDPQKGVNAFRKLLSTLHPGVIIVATNSSTAMACAPIANKKKVVLFSPISSSPSITHAGNFVFRNRVSGYYEAKEMAEYAVNLLKLKKVALVVINNEAAQGYINAFTKTFEKLGRKITKTVLINPGETDYRTPIIQVKSSNPEGVFLATVVKDAALFIKQSAELGFKPQWLSMTTIQSEDLFKIAGETAEGLIFVAEGGDENDPVFQKFAQRFEKKFAYKPTMNALNGYDAGKIISRLVAKYGSNGGKIRDALYKIKSYHGVGGILSFDKNGDANKPLKLFIVQKGHFVSYK